jgi:hypothetical protein
MASSPAQVFTLDDHSRGLEASREQVAALFQSINAPHVVVPGKRAGPAQAFIACLRGTHGFSVAVYLWLSETKECAVYTTSATAQTPEEYRALQTEALGFVESMGFMMDNLNFRSLTPEHQAELLQSVPVWRGGRAATGGTPAVVPSAGATPGSATSAALARLFSSF